MVKLFYVSQLDISIISFFISFFKPVIQALAPDYSGILYSQLFSVTRSSLTRRVHSESVPATHTEI